MKTAIVILNWNTENYLSEFLPTLQKSLEADSEIIVIDNASSDNSIKLMKDKFPNIKTICLDKNYGFTGGYNKGLEKLEGNYTYYVLLNSDIEVSSNWLRPLSKYMDTNTNCAVCGPKLLSYYDKESFEYAGAAGGYLDKYGYPFCRGRILNYLEKDKGQYNDIKKVFWISGACMMIRASLFHKENGFDSRFFAHMEEIELCWRLQLASYDICIIPESFVYHVGGGTLPNNSPFKLKLNFRNNLLMLYKNLAKTYALEFYNRTHNIEQASKKALKKADRVIFVRKLLDGLSALAYLCTGKLNYIKAIWEAHQEADNLKLKSNKQELIYFLSNSKNISIKGLYSKWMIPRALFCKKRFLNKIEY